MPESLLEDRAVTDSAVRVYALIARYDSMPQGAHPKQETLAERLGCSEKTIGRAAKSLEETGWIMVIRKRGSSNRYRLLSPDKSVSEPAEADTSVPQRRTEVSAYVERPNEITHSRSADRSVPSPRSGDTSVPERSEDHRRRGRAPRRQAAPRPVQAHRRHRPGSTEERTRPARTDRSPPAW